MPEAPLVPKKEPVALMSALRLFAMAVIGTAIAFDVPINEGQNLALAGLVAASLELWSLVWTRGEVTAKPK